ncbi:hypothetical protein IFR05_010530 [Cadophora sp. M221]|nr:hypothetical protein IFR05_010530 [Cadophora sp. M221]
MPAPPRSPWVGQHAFFRALDREVQRQLAVVEGSISTHGNDHDQYVTLDPVVTLERMGPGYSSELRALAKRLENLFDTLEPDFDPDFDRRFSRGGGNFLVPNPQLFWQISAFCEPSSQYIDIKRCLSRSFDSSDPIPYNSELWESEELMRWASAEVSHILLVQGDYQCSDEIGEICIDLVRYLQEHDQPVVWIPYDMSISSKFQHADDVLKQLAIQILRQNTHLHFDVHLPRLHSNIPSSAHQGKDESEQSSSKADPVIGEIAAAKGVAKGPADWFTQMKSFEKLIDASRKEPDAEHPRVRVAILDTGLDLSHRDIIKAKEEGRLQYWDFVDDAETIKDDDGHGTHCTSIALQYAPNADIFVGRVFRKSQADPDSCATLTKVCQVDGNTPPLEKSSANHTTQAIRHAAENWKVNIISLSLGFTEDNDDLRAEIRSASAKILVFASAANNTINEVKPVRFPASMIEVICIFSSNSFRRPSDFNPDPRYDRPNLTFPGEKVKGAWPSHLTDAETVEWRGATYKYQSGTSCSTPLAAAVAAGVLEFAWQERTPPVRRVSQLRHYTGMTQIFMTRMVDDYKVGDNSYNYVKPWKLISTSCRKEEINVLISDVLENMKK